MRYVSAGLDLPNRRTELQILDNAVATCLAALGRSSEPEPAALLLPAATVGVVRTMVEQRSGIATSVRVARDEAAAALDALQTARERVGEERAVPEPARARLASALSKARASGHLREIRTAREAEDAGTIRWQAAIRAPASMVRRCSGARRDLGSERRADRRMEDAGCRVRARTGRSFPNVLPNMRATTHCSRRGWTPFVPRSTSPTMRRRPRSGAPGTRPGQGIGQTSSGETADDFAVAIGS